MPPQLLQCQPLWEGLRGLLETWAKQTFGDELPASFSDRSLIAGKGVTEQFSERFGYICLPHSAVGLRAITFDRFAVTRYASLRLKQPADSLEGSPDLFLRLMADRPARELWKLITDTIAISAPLPEDFSVVDPAGVPDAIEADARLLKVVVSFVAEDDEEGWLLEGGEVPPEIQLYFEIESLKAYANAIEASAAARLKAGNNGQREHMRKNLRRSTIGLDAVLDRLQMTIADCSRLQVGQVIELPGAEPGVLSLCADTMNGSVPICSGELGTWKGQRALKLKSSLLESFVQEISEI
ncbi:FliM/FliN family flagellar motor switch protein [Henriciella litoralis]|uniref:FliM/FliN family flagellar motor switch protein n=1 Tax=Henriciella litoralis TaxID=568102 RepID=UPI001F41170B|nr:FliM/FliN family flagellar motor C-terminal domain-containing protein [Henriciella litoralis]